MYIKHHSKQHQLTVVDCRKKYLLHSCLIVCLALRKFSCEYCEYRSSTSSGLKRHLRSHLKSKPYRCPHCPTYFRTIEALTRHVLNSKKHPGLHLYNCIYCTEFKSNSVKLMAHHLTTSHSASLSDQSLEVKVCFRDNIILSLMLIDSYYKYLICRLIYYLGFFEVLLYTK